jgi:hypothetical protein
VLQQPIIKEQGIVIQHMRSFRIDNMLTSVEKIVLTGTSYTMRRFLAQHNWTTATIIDTCHNSVNKFSSATVKQLIIIYKNNNKSKSVVKLPIFTCILKYKQMERYGRK